MGEGKERVKESIVLYHSKREPRSQVWGLGTRLSKRLAYNLLIHDITG